MPAPSGRASATPPTKNAPARGPRDLLGSALRSGIYGLTTSQSPQQGCAKTKIGLPQAQDAWHSSFHIGSILGIYIYICVI